MKLPLALIAAAALYPALGTGAHAQTEAQIKQRIIRQSIAAHRYTCPCPYSVDRMGRPCGARSSYSRATPHAPLCYPADVTPAQVQAARGR